jgi:hypothetical protein
MKIGVVTISIDRECSQFSDQVVFGRGTTEEYCYRRGYDYHVIESLPSIDRQVAWYKFPVLQQLLHQYDWLLWLDTDTLIMDQTRRLEEWVNVSPETHFIFSHCVAMPINSGVWFVRSGEVAQQRLSEWWTGPEEPPNKLPTGCFWEQWAVNQLYKPEESIIRDDLSGIIRFSSRHARNLFYTPGKHWIAHFAGCQKYGRSIREMMASYIPRIKR